MCLEPLSGWRTQSGTITMSAGEGFRDKPISISCGRCMECRLERQRQWALRMMHEASCHEANSFITLTYDNYNLPPDTGLVLEHWQKFAKRLRKAGHRFKFYHCGEYGEQTSRPHYHAALFGVNFLKDRRHYKLIKGNQYYTSPTLTNCWGLGHCVLGDLTWESASYVAGYITKKLFGAKADNEYRYIDPLTGEVFELKPPYSTMSRNKGIGHDWYLKFQEDIYPRDAVLSNGRLSRPPKYYDRLHDVTHPIGMAEIKSKRVNELRTSPKAKEAATFEKRKVRYIRHSKKRDTFQREPGALNS